MLRASSKEEALRHISVRLGPAVVLGSLVGITGCPSLASTLPAGCLKSTTISVGDTVRTSFGTNSCQEVNGTYVDFYNVAVTGQGNLVISVSSSTPTYLMVYDPLRTPVVNSAFVHSPDTSAAVRVMLDSASYQIAVRDTLGKVASYRLSVSRDLAPAAGCGVIWITTGITTTQSLTTSDCTAGSGSGTHYSHRYLMVIGFGVGHTFTDTSTAFGPSMALISSAGAVTSSTLDGTGTVATLASFSQVNQDYYQLWAGTTNALQTGTYKLTVK